MIAGERPAPVDGRRSTQEVRAFYDDLAPDYRLLFPDWRASSARQAAALDRVIEAELGPAAPAGPARRLLDAAAGVGTQLLGLAALGYRCTGSDLSALALHRAAVEAADRDIALAGLAAAAISVRCRSPTGRSTWSCAPTTRCRTCSPRRTSCAHCTS